MLKNILTVLSGSLAGQLVALAALPFLSRLYPAGDFGRFQIYFSWLNVVLMFSTLRYEVALLSVQGDAAYRNLLRLIARIIVALTFAVAILIGIAALFFNTLPHDVLFIGFLMIPGTFFGGIFQTLTYLPMRFQNYVLSAKAKLVQSCSYVGAALLLTLFPTGGFGLPLADLFARFTGACMLIYGTKGTLKSASRNQTFADFRATAKIHRRFPLITLPGTALTALTATILPLVFARIFGLEVAGQYALVDRFLMAPTAILAVATMQVFTGQFSEIVRDNPQQANGKFREVVRHLALVAILPCIVGAILAPRLIPLIFGENWVLAGRLCAIAMPIAFVIFITMPVNMVILLCGRQKVQFFWELGRSSLLILSLLPLLWTHQLRPETVMILYAMIVFVSYTVFLILADWVTRSTTSIQFKLEGSS